MNVGLEWILVIWSAFTTPTHADVLTFEECKARAERHVKYRHGHDGAPGRVAFCIRRDGNKVVQIDPPAK